MLQRMNAWIRSIRDSIAKSATRLGPALTNTATNGARTTINSVTAMKGTLALLGLAGGIAYVLYQHAPLQSIGRGEVGVRTNLFTGSVTEWQDGTLSDGGFIASALLGDHKLVAGAGERAAAQSIEKE